MPQKRKLDDIEAFTEALLDQGMIYQTVNGGGRTIWQYSVFANFFGRYFDNLNKNGRYLVFQSSTFRWVIQTFRLVNQNFELGTLNS